ncbi:hypothetical protein D3C80_1622680 [compost metagenome]
MPSGTTMHSTARNERKVSRQNRPTEQNSAASIHTSACLTASLDAAITPTLPPARWNVACGTCTLAMMRRASLTTWATVAPSWSLRNTSTCMRWQPSVTRPESGV